MKVGFSNESETYLRDIVSLVRSRGICADILTECVHEGIKEGYDVIYCHPCASAEDPKGPDDPNCIEGIVRTMSQNLGTLFIVPGTYPNRIKLFEKDGKIKNLLFLVEGFGLFHKDPVGFIQEAYDKFKLQHFQQLEHVTEHSSSL